MKEKGIYFFGGKYGNFLIVHGGRNDYSSDSFALNDTFIFELSKFEWIEVRLYFDTNRNKIFNRCGHSALIYSKSILSL